MREHYLNDPADTAPEEVLTEILWPVQKKAVC
jgi:effector-binding domain-containing protein